MKYNDQDYNEIRDYATHLINFNKLTINELRNNLRINDYPEELINKLTLDILDNYTIQDKLPNSSKLPFLFRNKYSNFIMHEFNLPLIIIFSSQYSTIIKNNLYLYSFIIFFVLSVGVDKYYLDKIKHSFPNNFFKYLLKLIIQLIIIHLILLIIPLSH